MKLKLKLHFNVSNLSEHQKIEINDLVIFTKIKIMLPYRY